MSQSQRKNSSTEQSAKSVNEAVELALKELDATRDNVEIEVIDEGSKGFLGIGARDAKVRVTLKSAVKPANKAEKPAKKTGDEEKKNPNKRAISYTEAAETAAKFLDGIFKAMNLEVQVDAKTEEDSVEIELSGDNMGIVIGKRGDTLDSLQYLTSLVVNRESEDYIKVSIDTENYREKRTEALISLSNRLADKVARTGKKFTLEPMNPYERRVIHSNLQDNEEVTTFSIGSEPYRKVVIAPKNAKPYRKNNSRRRNDRPQRSSESSAEKTGSYTTTYKADFKPQQHKAEYKNFEDYLAAQQAKENDEM